MMKISACSHCNSPKPKFSKKSGRVGRVTPTTWYRETVTCSQCNISVTAGTPGNAVALWNKAASSLFNTNLIGALKNSIEYANSANTFIAGCELPAALEWKSIVDKAEGRSWT